MSLTITKTFSTIKMEDKEVSVVLRFVVPKGKTEASCSEELALTFETSAENGLEPQWISHSDTLKLNPKKTVRLYFLLAY